MTSPSASAQAAINTPPGGGAVKGLGESFQANLFSGTGNHSLPIALSPGRSGFGPALTLEYSSGHGNGLFGLGWQLSLPRIARKTEKGLPRFDDGDVFVLSGADDLVPCLEREVDPQTGAVRWQPEAPLQRGDYLVHRYRPRTEGLLARIERWVHGETGATHWRTLTKDNITSVFGNSADSRLADPADSSRVQAWLLRETVDAKGNHSLCEYAADDPTAPLPDIFEQQRLATQRYIRRLYYGNLPAGLATTYADGSPVGAEREGRRYAFEAVFDYGDWDVPTLLPHPAPPLAGMPEVFAAGTAPLRPDRFSDCRAGFDIRTLRLCRRVLMFHHFAELGSPTLVRSTDFNYQTDPETQASLLASATVTGYQRDGDGSYRSASMPPVLFSYSAFRPREQRYQRLQALGGQLPPQSLGDPAMALVDLFGDGLPDVLHTGPEGFRYWRNLGNGVFDRPQALAQMPAGLALDQAGVGFGDMAGNGIADLLVHAGPLPGFFETTPEGAWQRFRPYDRSPGFDPADPNLRMVDLTGDGRADALITQDEHFLWFACLGEAGFAAPRSIPRIHDLAQFPDVFFDDPSGRVRLADMTGDGLNDIVLLHDGRIDYWPNLGYGRFGARITMANSPRIEQGDPSLDPKRLFLADLNGTGCADLVHVGPHGVDFWFNQCGNAWSERQGILGTPTTNDGTSLLFADIFGTGTATLVWSHDFSSAAEGHYEALDFCGGIKPYVLTGMDNSMGATTHVSYAPSTRYVLEDRANGRPWLTTLPFPVQVVDRVEVVDHIGGSKRVGIYKYHHGHYDGREREFCGFARVDHVDTQTFEEVSAGDPSANADAAYHAPPVETRSWFHTGLYLGERDLSEALRAEYYDEDTAAVPLDAHDVETGDSPAESYRALRGAAVRTEVYARDGSAREPHPYQVGESRHRVLQLQPALEGAHSVVFSHALESLSYHYERRPADPRIGHQLTLAVDGYGNPLRTLSIAYGRRQPDPDLPGDAERLCQTQTLITCTESRYTQAIDDPRTAPDVYRAPLPCESITHELTGFSPLATDAPRFSHAEWVADDFARIESAASLAYEEALDRATPQKRLIQHTQTSYRRDDLGALLPLGTLESLALPGETRRLALTDGLLAQLYGERVTAGMLAEAGYAHGEDQAGWWVPGGQAFYSPGTGDSPADELLFAQRHFFIPHRSLDAFGQATTTLSDPYVLLVTETRDAIGNTTRAEHDYRVMQAFRTTDVNGNRQQLMFDTLGRLAGTALMGKAGETVGDSFEGFVADLSAEQRDAFLADPLGNAAALLGTASTRIVHDLDRYRREQPPVFAATLSRETHASDPVPEGGLRVRISLAHADGFGRPIQTKALAEPGPVAEGGPVVTPRWVASGWTVLDNKGKPVKTFEPFFDDTHAFRFDQREGLATSMFYDPLGRMVATLHPDHRWQKVTFDAWQQASWDSNDTLSIDDPKDDADVGGFFRRLPESDYLPTWHQQRAGGALGAAEQAAASNSEVHAATPTIAHADVLGRSFLTLAHNRFERDGTVIEEREATRIVLDIEAHPRELIDAAGRIATRHGFDMLGTRALQASMDAGERRSLNDVAGQPAFVWDSRGQRFRQTFDALRRPLELFLQQGSEAERLIGRSVYGESQPEPESLNLRGRLVRIFDPAGMVANEAYDFKGNLLAARRQLAADYHATPDWSVDPPLDAQVFSSLTSYDALNRPVAMTSPDGSVTWPRFNAAGQLESLAVQLRGAAEPTAFVTSIDYDAKGRRLAIAYGNGLRTTHRHDAASQRLMQSRTLRGIEPLQDLAYAYDPEGNLTHIEDAAQQSVYFRNQVVTPSADYAYDALYRLLRAEGREHIGQADRPETSWNDAARVNLPHPNDGQAMRRYVEHYAYDVAGNFQQLLHQAANGNWQRSHTCAEASLIEPGKTGDRLSSVALGSGAAEAYPCDAHGNITAMPHLPSMGWDCNDRLQRVDLGGGGIAWYVYDAAGQRVRKVIEKNGGNLVEERISLGGFEVFRRRNAAGAVLLERESLHVIDEGKRIALVDTRTQGDEPEVPAQVLRYQFGNHLGSAVLEVDGAGQIISYEEYYPFGSSSYQAGRSAAEVSSKRYRYTGMERDEETGLSLHGARYYAPWLGRWTAPDPIGPSADGSNLYAYVGNRPIGRIDPSGLEGEKTQQQSGAGGASPAEGDERHTRLMEFTQLLGQHGAKKSFITHILGLNDDDKVLARHGYTPPGRFEPGPVFQSRVRLAILAYHLDWQASRGGNQASASPVSAAQDADTARRSFNAAWLEGAPHVTGSLGGAAGAEIASHFTDDQKKITAAAGFGDSVFSVATSFAQAKGNQGSYSPKVENEPFMAAIRRANVAPSKAAAEPAAPASGGQRDVARPSGGAAPRSNLVKRGNAFGWRSTTDNVQILQVAEAAARKGATEIHILTNVHGERISGGFALTEKGAGAFFGQDARTQGVIQAKYPNTSVILHDAVDPGGFAAYRAAASRAMAQEPGVFAIGGTCYSANLLVH